MWVKQLMTNNVLSESELFQSLEGIGDILVFQATRKGRQKNTIESLKKLVDIVIELIEKEKSSVISFKDNFKLSNVSTDNLYIAENENNIRNCEKYADILPTALNQILRTHESAIRHDNSDVSRNSVYGLSRILKCFASVSDKSGFIELVLKSMHEALHVALKYDDVSMHSAGIHWYTSIVFGYSKINIDLKYLNIFDKYLFWAISAAINKGSIRLYESTVSSLTSGLNIGSRRDDKFHEISSLLMRKNIQDYSVLNEEIKLQKRIRELRELSISCYTLKELTNWLEQVDELIQDIANNSDFDVSSIDDLIEYIKLQGVKNFKLNNLIEIVFSVGAYCLFKEQYHLIKILWEYKQPPDSDGHWVGHDVVPNTLKEIISLYYHKGYFEREFMISEGHHGSRIYFNQYFILLLSRICRNKESFNEQMLRGICKSPIFDIYTLSYIAQSVDEHIMTTTKLFERKSFLLELGFTKDELSVLEENLKDCLNLLKNVSESEMENIHKNKKPSIEKTSSFEKGVLDGYRNSTSIQKIFSKYGHFKNIDNEIFEPEKDKLFLVNRIDDKAAFFDEWHVSYGEWGVHYGENASYVEENWIVNKILDNENTDEVNKLTDLFSEDANYGEIGLIAGHSSLYDYLEDNKYFTSKWSSNLQTDYDDIESLEGFYSVHGKNLPVFRSSSRLLDKHIILISENNFPDVYQAKSTDESELHINVDFYSEEPALIDKLLSEKPDFLREYNSETEQREFLLTKSNIKIFEYIKIDFKNKTGIKIFRVKSTESE